MAIGGIETAIKCSSCSNTALVMRTYVIYRGNVGQLQGLSLTLLEKNDVIFNCSCINAVKTDLIFMSKGSTSVSAMLMLMLLLLTIVCQQFPTRQSILFSRKGVKVFSFLQITHLDVPLSKWHFESLLALH